MTKSSTRADTGSTLHCAPPDMRIFLPVSLFRSYTVTRAPAFAAKYAAVRPAAPPQYGDISRVGGSRRRDEAPARTDAGMPPKPRPRAPRRRASGRRGAGYHRQRVRWTPTIPTTGSLLAPRE